MLTIPLPTRASFSVNSPWIQHTWDSSSLGTFLKCPRRYFLGIVCGYRTRGENVHLTFGTLIHRALELYNLNRYRGHEEAQIAGLEGLLKAAWNRETESYWRSHDPNKNLWNCLRSFIWFTEQFKDTPQRTAVLGDKLLAIELPFQFGLGLELPGSLEVNYSGHLDHIVEDPQGNRWVEDYKSTKHTLDSGFYASYRLSTQLPGYGVAAKVVFKELVHGVQISGIQVAVDFTRCGKGHLIMDESRCDQWLSHTRGWVRLASHMALSHEPRPAATLHEFAARELSNWPMNTESCFLCPFKLLCSENQAIHSHLLETAYSVHFWDPIGRDQGARE